MTTPFDDLLRRVRATLGDPPLDPAGRLDFGVRADLATLGVLHAERGDWASAANDFARLLASDPRARQAWGEVVVCCRRQAGTPARAM